MLRVGVIRQLPEHSTVCQSNDGRSLDTEDAVSTNKDTTRGTISVTPSIIGYGLRSPPMLTWIHPGVDSVHDHHNDDSGCLFKRKDEVKRMRDF